MNGQWVRRNLWDHSTSNVRRWNKSWSMAGMCTKSGALLSRVWSEGRKDDRTKGGSAPWNLLGNCLGKRRQDWSLLGNWPDKRNNLRLNWERGWCGRPGCGQLCGSLWWCSSCNWQLWLEEDMRLGGGQAGSGSWGGEGRVGNKVRLGRSRGGVLHRSRVGVLQRSRVGVVHNKSVLRRMPQWLESWS